MGVYEEHAYSHSMSNTLWNPLFKGILKKFVLTLYKRYFIFYPLLYEYAYKLGVSYKVCIRRLYNALGSDSVCQRLKYYSHSIVAVLQALM